MEPEIIYCDKDVAVLYKPGGFLSQEDRSTDPDMVNWARNNLSGEVFLINRLDRPVSGLMLFGRNKNAAASLGSQMQKEGSGIGKRYIACLSGLLPGKSGELSDYILKEKTGGTGRVCKKGEPGAKEALLHYDILRTAYKNGISYSLADIRLITGRFHQIRIQTSSRDAGILGDTKYNRLYMGGKAPEGDILVRENRNTIALSAAGLSFSHPLTKKTMEFRLPPEKFGWTCELLKGFKG